MKKLLTTAMAATLLASTAAGAWAQAAPTPECGDDDDPTPRQMEGPFFKPRTPQRISLLPFTPLFWLRLATVHWS